MISLRPQFDVPSQTWHWWSTPGVSPSWAEDAAHAKPVEARWTVDKDGQGGRRWDGRFDALPGFAPFLWAVADGHLWLRRPEGVWKTPLPNLRERDYLSLKEHHETLGHRGGLLVSPDKEGPAWHVGESPITLEQHDAGMFSTVVVDGKPMLRNHRMFTSRMDSVTTVHLPQWSEPGSLVFRAGRGQWDGVEHAALVITLPNGVEVVEAMAQNPLLALMIKRNRAMAVLGDDLWMPRCEQVIKLAVSDDVFDGDLLFVHALRKLVALRKCKGRRFGVEPLMQGCHQVLMHL